MADHIDAMNAARHAADDALVGVLHVPAPMLTRWAVATQMELAREALNSFERSALALIRKEEAARGA